MNKHGVRVDTEITPCGEIYISLVVESGNGSTLTARYTEIDLMRDVRSGAQMEAIANSMVKRVLDRAEEQLEEKRA
jgi:hypothetical protein